MKAISLDEALALIEQADSMSKEELATVQKERLNAIVKHARTHSAVYREKYADLPENPALGELPAITKQELTSRMSEWVCDPDFSEDALISFINESEDLSVPFMGKYGVSTTSGTTGEPLRMLKDERHITVNAALLKSRLFDAPLLKDIDKFADPKAKYACVLATGGHYSAVTAYEKRRKAMEDQGITDTMILLPVGEPVETMVDRLNAFQPDIMTGYPSVLHILSGEQLENRLNISPRVILCSAEQLTDDVRVMLEERFNCPVGNVFCSTEGGEVALLCEHGHMHLNTDWILVEPVDDANNPVPAGTMSSAVLVTNLMNAVQPIIRYKVDDSMIIHHTPCACGRPFPYVDILGRTDDLPEFEGPNGCVRLSPIAFLAHAVDVEGIGIYQFIQKSPTELSIRVQYLEEANRETVNSSLKNAIEGELAKHGLSNVTFTIENKEPHRAPKGKKMKSYRKDF